MSQFKYTIRVFILIFFTSGTNAFASLTDGLVAYYPFSGNANDESGNGNNGLVNGAVLTVDRFGQANSAYSFDGTTNYILVPSSSSLEIQDAITLSAWVYHSSNASPQHIVNMSALSTGYRLAAWWANPAGNALELYDLTQSQHIADDGRQPDTGVWTHVAATWDGSVMRVYRDGVLGGETVFSGNISVANNDLYIGVINPVPFPIQGFFHGNIDEVRIYNRALSESDIKQLAEVQLQSGTRLTIGAGSYFTFASDTRALFEGEDGLVLGAITPAAEGSYHEGPPDGRPGEQGGITQSVEFFGGTGTFWTESPVTDLGNGFVDMSGWRGAWGSYPTFTFDAPLGVLYVVGNDYILEYSGISTAPPPFVNIPYFLHLEGQVVPASNVPPDCTQAAPSIGILWSANHELVPIDILGVTDLDGDPVSITVDRIFQDEPVNELGDGDFSPDGTGVGTTTAYVRAERSGKENGRVYHISFTAEDGQGGACSEVVLVEVPHDQARNSVDDGALYDSTVE